METAPIDLFSQICTPANLCVLADGTPAFLLKKPNLKSNSYDSRLCLLQNGKIVKPDKMACIKGLWPMPNGGAVFSAMPLAADLAHKNNGFPLTVLHLLCAKGKTEEWLRLPYDIDDIVFLTDGRFLFTAVCDPDREAILATSTSDKEAKKALAEAKAVEVATTLPIWHNGGGFAARRHSRLYVWNQGQVEAISSSGFDVESMHLTPDGSAVFCVLSKMLDISGLENQLYFLDTQSMSFVDVSPQQPFNYNKIIPISAHEAVVYGTDMRQYGVSQNGDFFVLDMAAKTFESLNSGGMYNSGNNIGTDCALPSQSHWLAVHGTVYFHSTVGASSAIFSMDGTGNIQRLTHFEGAVLELATDGNGQIYFTAMQDETGPELYLLLAKGHKAITHFNTTACKKVQFSPPLPLSFANANGHKIDGWVLAPTHKTSKASPAILYIHGGPKSTYGHALFAEMQYLAANGFAVMYCNPTGSDGKGNAFADIRGRYGQVDYDDLMTFVDEALLAHPWIDSKRLGVAGGSYGGFMANWITGHSQRFAAAVSERAVNNWASMAATSDIGHFFAPDQMACTGAEDNERLWSFSPLKYAKNVHTPTLILHSDMDYRCWMVEALQWFSALKQNGTEVRMCLFKGENHELSRSGKPQNRVRRLQEILAWFKAYL